MPKVSVVIPAYNNADYIEATLESVFAQTYADYDVVIADHSSTDATMHVLEKFADRSNVTVLTTPAGGGAERNWNRVTEASSGELVKLLCADDLIYPDCIADQVAALDAAPSAVMAASPRDIVDADGVPIVRSRGLGGLKGLVRGGDAVRRSVRAGTNIFGEPGCTLIRRTALDEVGGWDGSYPYLIDQYSYSKVLLTGDFAAVPRTAAAFRVNAGQWSVRLAKAQARQAADCHRALHAAHPDVISRTDVAIGNARAQGTAYLRRAAYIYLRGRMGRAAAAQTS